MPFDHELSKRWRVAPVILRDVLRTRHYSHRTEKTYCYWVRYFIRFHGMRHPLEMGRGFGLEPD